MGESAMMGEAKSGAADTAKHIEVRRFGGERQRESGQSSLAIEAGAPQTCAGQEVGNGFQAVSKDCRGRWEKMPTGREVSRRSVSGSPTI